MLIFIIQLLFGLSVSFAHAAEVWKGSRMPGPEPHVVIEDYNESWFITEKGFHEIIVAAPKQVERICGKPGALWCIGIIGDKNKKENPLRIPTAILVKKLAVALHVCARILAMDAGWSEETIERELSSERLGALSLENLLLVYGNEPAAEKPCGDGSYFTGLGLFNRNWTKWGNPKGGRLLTPREFGELLQENEKAD